MTVTFRRAALIDVALFMSPLLACSAAGTSLEDAASSDGFHTHTGAEVAGKSGEHASAGEPSLPTPARGHDPAGANAASGTVAGSGGGAAAPPVPGLAGSAALDLGPRLNTGCDSKREGWMPAAIPVRVPNRTR